MRLTLTPRAYEFACHSRACAPPPVGGGGSKSATTSSTVSLTGNKLKVSEALRVARIAQSRKDIAGEKTLAESDHLGGHPRGMLDTPPPAGLTKVQLTDDHLAALLAYRGEDYNLINGSLRYGIDLGAEAKGTAAVVSRMDQVFDMTSPTKADIVVYRAMGIDTPSEFQDKGFMSTGYDRSVVERFATEHHVEALPIIKIVIPAGSHAVKLSDEQGIGESEILLPRGANLKLQPDGSYRYMGSTPD